MKIPYLLFGLYLGYFTFLAFNPHDRGIWWAENLPIMAVVALLAFTYRRFQFSNTAYLLMAVLIFLHTTGAHYTFALVPFDAVSGLLGFERNHFNRIAHFSVGFYAYAVAEFVMRQRWANAKLLFYSFPLFAIMGFAAFYEIVEWLFAVMANPEAGIAFLGSQGDVWDAQKDMLADTLGAAAVLLLFALTRNTELEHSFRRN